MNKDEEVIIAIFKLAFWGIIFYLVYNWKGLNGVLVVIAILLFINITGYAKKKQKK